MSNGIQAFIEYLLNTNSTSEISFSQEIEKNNQLFHVRYRNDFEQVIERKLRHWQNINQTEQNVAVTVNVESVKPSQNSSQNEQKKPLQIEQTVSLSGQSDGYVNVVCQCERLLQFLHYCRKRYTDLTKFYFQTLSQCVKSENDNMAAVALRQISFNLSETTSNNKNERKRLRQCLPSNMSLSTIPKSDEPIFATIKSFPSTTQNTPKFTIDQFDALYPSRARFLDARREFRDSTQYFIDGDSLLLFIVHHSNVDLLLFHGHTLHVIFIIERILLVLFDQAHQSNYTLVFFDCNYEVYRCEASIIDLLRACLFTHLSKNADKCGKLKVRQFNSWLGDDYVTFTTYEEPMFMFYHDMSNFNGKANPFISENVLQELVLVYRHFGNYHQYVLCCRLYLMNNLTLTNSSVECFQIEFLQQCPMNLLRRIVKTGASQFNETIIDEKNRSTFENICHETAQSDVRLFIYLQSIVSLIKETKDSEEVDSLKFCIPLLVLHIALLIRLSLVDRHLPSSLPPITFHSILSKLISEFQERLCSTVLSSSSSLSWSKIADLFDGRLFVFTLQWMNQSSSNIRFDSITLDIIKQSLNLLNMSSNDNELRNLFEQIFKSKYITFSKESFTINKPQRRTIPKISNPFLDVYLKPIFSSNSDQLTFDFVNPTDCQRSQYQGKHHWHVYKQVDDEVSRVRDTDKENVCQYRYRTRSQQKFYHYFNLYAESLKTSDVKDGQQRIVLPIAPTPVLTTSTNTTDDKKKRQPKKIHETKAQKIIEENKQRRADKLIDEETNKLINVEADLERITEGHWSEAINLIDRYLVNFETSARRLELIKKKFRLQRKYLRALRKQIILTNEDKPKLDLLQIDYFTTMTEIVHLENIVDASSRMEKYMIELVDDSALDREKWYRFQLEKINSRLPRRENDVRDDRTPDFIPDKWQVEFLDAVDKHQSIIIVAPTASGKTYASYYAMKKVLNDKHNSNGVCVYVTPTKALVNQVAATVYSKFGPVFGIFTRDYRVNMEACRILVTVPQCLEILLLSPTYQHWCQRIGYAIFDEIHCMSGDIGSEVWERTMLLINAPIIGLSATVNNGDDVRRWLQSIEDRRASLFNRSSSRRVCFIAYYERMADLNKYLYAEQQLYPIHPVGLMNAKQLIDRGIPSDFSLSPRETLQLNDAMQKTIENIKNTINHNVEYKPVITLHEHFSPAWLIERNACNVYSRLVYNQFNHLISNKQHSAIDSITKSLNVTSLDNVKYPEKKNASSLIVEFVLTLKEKNLLPCIVFSDNRSLCEDMAKRVARVTGYDLDFLNNELIEGTLADRHRCDSKLAESLLELVDRSNSKLANYMRRGVAFHHAGLNNKSRIAVEALFRNRFIKIIFSTSTLAMGIHMPTKTVAFLNDSIYLDALHYRQSSGRAGRRGFDDVGHVIFLDIPLSKIRHLTLSKIPNIEAHFPTTVTFLMRLFHFCLHAQDSKDAINRSLITLECPFIFESSKKQVLIDIQTRFHCLHTLDFLHQLNLINSHGDLTGLAGLSTHLHYFEPANILLVHLIDTKLFHEMNDPKEIVTVLAYLFANVPWLMKYEQFEALLSKRREQKFNSKLFLPPISDQFRKRVQSYNSIVQDVYGLYIENVARRMRSFVGGHEQILPLSNISFVGSSDYDNGTLEYDLHHHYSQQQQNPSISPFAGPSGLTHLQFMSNYTPSVGSWDLAYYLDLSPRILPFVDIDCRDQTHSTYYLNSYALDFFIHGSEQLLQTENQLNPGDTYKLLLDFHLVLSSIKTSLEIILANEEKQTTSTDIDFFRPLYERMLQVQQLFSFQFSKQYSKQIKTSS